MRSLFALIEKLDNGFVVKYPEAVEREHTPPNPLDAIGDAQIELMVGLANLQSGEDEEDQAWKGDDSDQSAKMRERIAKLRARITPKPVKHWVIEEREFFCTGKAGMSQAIDAAASAQEQIEALTRQGIRIQPGAATGVVAVSIGHPPH
jgi:hypothetical protein